MKSALVDLTDYSSVKLELICGMSFLDHAVRILKSTRLEIGTCLHLQIFHKLGQSGWLQRYGLPRDENTSDRSQILVLVVLKDFLAILLLHLLLLLNILLNILSLERIPVEDHHLLLMLCFGCL